MKILHGPIEIAGQMGIISSRLRQMGHEAEAFNTFHSYLGYRERTHSLDEYELEWKSPEIIHYFDLFHFHYNASLTSGYSDLKIIKDLNKPMLMHYWGNDVRTHELATRNNPYAYTGDSPPPEQIEKSLKTVTSYIDYAVVQDYEVYPYVADYFKKVYVLPITMDVQSVQTFYPDEEQEVPLVIHAPTNPLFKGTEYVEKAISALQQEGVKFNYKRIEKMSNKEAISMYQKADIVVDQILCGSYGMLAVESMSLGKPVVGYIREDLVDQFWDVPPICSANPSRVYEVLKELIQNPKLRRLKGQEGRKYAETYHDIRVVCTQLLDIYKEIGAPI
ncbi:glycosyltransferase [Marinicrinis lubricantis]|uniref:Glycosyltransferase n=1 Tax=Marinicrinis lubricantis TaxID=2086470 RepID=A0ABW1IQP6_9BACL